MPALICTRCRQTPNFPGAGRRLVHVVQRLTQKTPHAVPSAPHRPPSSPGASTGCKPRQARSAQPDCTTGLRRCLSPAPRSIFAVGPHASDSEHHHDDADGSQDRAQCQADELQTDRDQDRGNNQGDTSDDNSSPRVAATQFAVRVVGTGRPSFTSSTVRSPSGAVRCTVAVRVAPTAEQVPAIGLRRSMRMTATATDDSTASAP